MILIYLQRLLPIAAKYGVSVRTIERDLEGMRYVQKGAFDEWCVKYKDVLNESQSGQKDEDSSLGDALRPEGRIR